ncbi:hypothetical protein, partial [Proteus mirabilis]|uniref:hypothetical protein n=1 Tax=Proteus mirabilis TaxID=584 RepID=UPI00313AC2CB
PQSGEALAAHGLAEAPRLGEAIDVSAGWEQVISWLLAPWLNARLVATHQLQALPEALATDWCLIDQALPAGLPNTGQ